MVQQRLFLSQQVCGCSILACPRFRIHNVAALLHTNSGGYVYRGEVYADLLYGAYVFADYESRLVRR